MKGLIVSVFRDSHGEDSSNDGITSKFSDLVLIGEGVPELFEPHHDMPAVKLAYRRQAHGPDYLYAVPVGEEGHHTFGGNFIYSSDTRFPNRYPIPVHDRTESEELQRLLSS